MPYEEEVGSFAALMRRLRVLDQDSGVRLVGGVGRQRFIVFVTRFGPKFTIMKYAMKKGGRTPGKRLLAVEAEVGMLERILKELAPGRVRAWIY